MNFDFEMLRVGCNLNMAVKLIVKSNITFKPIPPDSYL